MSTLNKGIEKVEVTLKWDPSPLGDAGQRPRHHRGDIRGDAPHGGPAYLVHFDSRSPDGTITLNRDSRTGQGFGFDEVMTLELDRLSDTYTRVVVGVAIQQGEGRKVFGDIAHTAVLIREGYTDLAENDFAEVADATAASVAEFARDEAGEWRFRADVRGFDTDPDAFVSQMGG